MRHLRGIYILLLSVLLGLNSCEKPVISDKISNQTKEDKSLCNVTFRVTKFDYIPFYKEQEISRSTDISKFCTCISLAIFKSGNKIKVIHQKSDKGHFGEIQLSLPAGNYQVVAIANGGNSSASIKSPTEISFAKSKLTDTFYYYAEITIGNNQTYNLEMKRVVAMFRLITTDKIPTDVKKLCFFYTGGSSTFNAVTGYGSKKSRQKEERDITDKDRNGNAVFEVYTFPHKQEDNLKIKISALNDAGNPIVEREFSDVPIRVNEITQYKGDFFLHFSHADSYAFSFYTQSEWTQREVDF